MIQAFSTPEILALGGCCSQLVVDPKSNIYITHTDNTSETQATEFRRSGDGGVSFQGPISFGPGAVSQMAEDPSGNIYVLWDNHGSTFYLSRSDDGGATFTIPISVDVPLDFIGFRQMVIDPTGNIDLLFNGFSGNQQVIYFTQSRDGGHNFSNPALVSIPARGSNDWASGADMALSPDGAINVVWSQAGLWFSRSSDGATFSKPVTVDPQAGGAQLAVDSKGNIFVTWGDASHGVALSRSTDAGATFSQPPRNGAGDFYRVTGGPYILVDAKDNVNILWSSVSVSAPEPDPPHVYFSRLTDGGTTVSGSRVDHDPDVPGSGRFGRGPHAPSMSVDSSGSIDVVWLDSLGAPCPPCDASDVYFSQSIDGGKSFAPSINISNQLGTKYPVLQISTDPTGNVYIAWTSDGTPDETNPFSSANLRFSRSIAPSSPSSLALSIDICCGPIGVLGNAYSGTVGADGGTPPYALRVSGLAPGLFPAQSPSNPGPTWGILGTPSLAGTFEGTFTVVDSAGLVVTANYPVTVGGAGAGWANIGNQTIGQQTDSGDSNRVSMFHVATAAHGGRLHSVNIYIASPVDPAPNNQFQVAIYSDNNGNPGTIMAISNPGTITPDSWNSVSLSVPLSPNTDYWLAYNTNGTSASSNNARLVSGGKSAWLTNVPFGGWPVSIKPSGSSTFTASAFLTYDPGDTTTSLATGLSNIGSTMTFPCDYRYYDCEIGSGDSNRITMSRFVSSGAGETLSISVFVAVPVSSATNNQFQLAVYSDNNGIPGNLIGATQVATITPGWNSLPLSIAIAPHTAYWLAYNTNGASASENNTATTGWNPTTEWMTQAFGTWPATAQPTGTSMGDISVYFTYAIGGTPAR